MDNYQLPIIDGQVDCPSKGLIDYEICFDCPMKKNINLQDSISDSYISCQNKSQSGDSPLLKSGMIYGL